MFKRMTSIKRQGSIGDFENAAVTTFSQSPTATSKDDPMNETKASSLSGGKHGIISMFDYIQNFVREHKINLSFD